MPARLLRVLTPAALALAHLTAPLSAQAVGIDLGLSAGVAPYDLAGTGTGRVLAGTAGLALGSFLVVEPGATVFWSEKVGGERTKLLLPEVSVQATARAGVVRPYLGGGVGLATELGAGDGTELTLHAVTGARVALLGGLGLRGEARLRSVNPFAGSLVDLTAGVTWRP